MLGPVIEVNQHRFFQNPELRIRVELFVLRLPCLKLFITNNLNKDLKIGMLC